MMSKSQRIKMMAELWPNACKAQGWSPNDKEKRYQVFAQVLTAEDYLRANPAAMRHIRKLQSAVVDGSGRHASAHISFNDFDNDDFDQVKAHLLMLADNLNGTIETDQPYRGQGRRLTFHARMHHEPLLKALGIEHTDGYLAAILRDRFKVKYESDLSQAPTYGKDQQRGPSQLMQYIMTVHGRIEAMRRKKGWTRHDLYTAAGLRCDCLACCKARRPRVAVLVPAESNQPF